MINFLNKLKEYAAGIFALMSGIFAVLFWYEKKQNEVQKAENSNTKTNDEVQSIQNQITNVVNTTKEEENAPATKDKLLDFLNNKSGK